MTPPPVRAHVSDPPPKPVALLEAVRAGAVVVDEHLLLHDIDRWLVCDREMGWVLVDAPVNGHVRIDVATLTLLRQVEPVGAHVELHGVRYSVRPVLLHAAGRGRALFVGLVAS